MPKKRLVVLTGAGISAESGLQTFRDADGLWEGYSVDDVATATAFRTNPARVLDFYNQRRHAALAAQPNAAHLGLVALERDFDVHIVTQNIDDLHERAGSSNVLHLHGQITKMRSVANDTELYPYDRDIHLGDLAADSTQLRPHIVWFEEPVPMIEKAAEVVRDADIFVVIGTSLQVYPAAGLINYTVYDIPKYIIDKRVPFVSGLKNLTVIEKPATEGVGDLQKLLKTFA